ncbi:unnamed protein product [Pieris macdunnoughi]|uniref:Transposase n=1 Tax=Pieris macdunnoughi TaxID=345717 RepID=A0A821UF67_9NEOP|nr:unnamed protein product [Pieris macdunnoughi]
MELPVVAPARCELRSVIKFLHAKKIPPIEIHRQLEEVYGEKCMDVKNVRKWCREFTAGRLNVHDEERSGRPSHSDETVRKVEELVLKDRRLTLNELAEKLQDVCSRDSIHSILVNNLQYRKLSARWVPKMLTPEHKVKRVQCAQDFLASFEEEGEEFLDSIVTGDETWAHYYTPETKEQSKQWRHTHWPKVKKFKQEKSAGKVMATVFWDRKGVLLIDFMPRGATINADRYCETLRKLRRAIQNKRRVMLTKGVRLHHDNARPHVANKTTSIITEFGWDVLDHPPYSPDVAPSDFHMFPSLKKHLGGMKFANDEEVHEAVISLLREAAGSWFEEGIQKFVVRMKKLIEVNGDYIEK